jgi:hypothetical protein
MTDESPAERVARLEGELERARRDLGVAPPPAAPAPAAGVHAVRPLRVTLLLLLVFNAPTFVLAFTWLVADDPTFAAQVLVATVVAAALLVPAALVAAGSEVRRRERTPAGAPPSYSRWLRWGVLLPALLCQVVCVAAALHVHDVARLGWVGFFFGWVPLTVVQLVVVLPASWIAVRLAHGWAARRSGG